MIKHINSQLRVVTDAFKNISENSTNILMDCLEVLARNGKIVASGLGKNVPICEKFIGTLNSVGIEAHFIHTNTAIHGDLGVIKDIDIVILLSKSGNTEETVRLARILRKRRVKTWLITCSKLSKLDRIVDSKITIPIKEEGDPWNLIPNNSTIVFLVFLQSLAMSLIERLRIPLKIFMANHPGGAIGDELRKLEK